MAPNRGKRGLQFFRCLTEPDESKKHPEIICGMVATPGKVGLNIYSSLIDVNQLKSELDIYFALPEG